MDDKKPSFERSVETDVCLQLVLKADEGETVPWASFEKALHQPLEDIRGYIASARRIALHEHEMDFDPVRGVGLKRLVPADASGVAQRTIEQTRRKAHRGLRRLAVADYTRLNQTQKAEHNTKMTVLAVIRGVAKPKNINKITDEVKRVQKRLPFGRTLDVLGITKNGDEEE